MTLHEQLRYIQHQWIPWLFYNGAIPFLRRLLSDQGNMFISLLDAMNEDELGYTCPYHASEFQPTWIKRGKAGAIVQITMPSPLQVADCREVYLIFSADFKERFYFTLELNADGGYHLCGWDITHQHLQFHFKYNGHDDDDRMLVAMDRIFVETDIKKSISNLRNWH